VSGGALNSAPTTQFSFIYQNVSSFVHTSMPYEFTARAYGRTYGSCIPDLSLSNKKSFLDYWIAQLSVILNAL